jgi:4-amino-4-deoxy-L-arabinose transferase-like glycosyltransferase
MSSIARSQPIRANSKPVPGSSPFLTVRLLHAIADFADVHGWLLFAAISVGCGWGLVKTMVSRHLDHDELFTFYIAQAPTLRQLFQTSHIIDLHPPLGYLLVRASFAMFGISSWSCRLPFLLAFVLAAAILFYLVRHLLSPLYALIVILFLWSTSFAYLAHEARPYSLLLCFTAAMVLGWHRATEDEGYEGRRWTLALITVSGFGLLLSHVLAVFVYAAFFGTELLRLWIRRKPDWHLWVALIVPLISVLSYWPLIRNQSTILYPEQYRATPLRMASFYWESIRFVATPLVLIALLALLWPVFHKQTPARPSTNLRPIGMPFAFLLIALALVTVVIGVLFARTGTAVFDRYIVVWLVPLVVVPA